MIWRPEAIWHKASTRENGWCQAHVFSAGGGQVRLPRPRRNRASKIQ